MTKGLDKIVGLHPGVREVALSVARYCDEQGVPVTFTSGKRSPEKQRELWANRHKNPNPVARPGTSAHEWGMAFDVAKGHGWEFVKAVLEHVGFKVIVEATALHAEVPGWRQYV